MGARQSFVESQAFLPPTPPTYQATDLPVQFVDTARHSRIPILFMKHPGQDYRQNMTILYSHGNATDLGPVSHFMAMLVQYVSAPRSEHAIARADARAEVNVLAYDYSGYGCSNGIPCESNAYSDIRAAYRYATQTLGIPEQKLILYGHSLGSGPTCDLASDKSVNPRAVVLHSPLLSAVRVVFDLSDWVRFPTDIFANLHKVPKIRCPVYIIHGLVDEVINVAHGRKLHELLVKAGRNPPEPWWVQNRGHNDIEVESAAEYLKRLRTFVRAVDEAGLEPAPPHPHPHVGSS